MNRKDEIDEQNLEETYFTSLRTVGALMNLLMLGRLYRKVDRVYNDQAMVSV